MHKARQACGRALASTLRLQSYAIADAALAAKVAVQFLFILLQPTRSSASHAEVD